VSCAASRTGACHVPAVEGHGAREGFPESGDHVEQSALTRTVGADQSGYLSAFRGQRDPVERAVAAERDRDVVNCEL